LELVTLNVVIFRVVKSEVVGCLVFPLVEVGRKNFRRLASYDDAGPRRSSDPFTQKLHTLVCQSIISLCLSAVERQGSRFKLHTQVSKFLPSSSCREDSAAASSAQSYFLRRVQMRVPIHDLQCVFWAAGCRVDAASRR
jgi:hypothetical protein